MRNTFPNQWNLGTSEGGYVFPARCPRPNGRLYTWPLGHSGPQGTGPTHVTPPPPPSPPPPPRKEDRNRRVEGRGGISK
eukprot:1668421-Pyramimonas_sp.AAC.1